MEGRITFRPIAEDDGELLLSLYAGSRELEMSVLDWTEAQKEAFLRQQFEMQHKYYRMEFPDADYLLMLLNGQGIGRIYILWDAQEIVVMDITLLPEYRGLGIGTTIFENLKRESSARQLPLRLHVEPYNRAFNLYRRLGFTVTAEEGFYYRMEWLPPRTERKNSCLI